MLIPTSRTIAILLAAIATAPAPAFGQAFDVMETTIPAAHAAMGSGRLTCRALVQAYLNRIEAYDKRGPALNSIQTVNPRALAEADSLDAVLRHARGKPPGRLHCVPVLLKDQVETKDMPTMYGSALFKDFIPARDATVVQRLEQAGAIIIAKTTMGEFASRYISSASGIIRNAYDPSRHPSGSSGGSGAAAAANFGLVALGEDTSGSIRGPAAVHSLIGLRPTVPLVSRHGMMPANPTQDTMGPMTRTVADAARVLDVIAGYDPNDAVTAYAVGQVPQSYTDALSATALRGARIGILRIRRDSTPGARRDTAAAPGDSTPVLRAATAAARDSAATRDSVNRVEYAKVSPLFERAIADLRKAGAVIVDSLRVPAVPGRSPGNSFETEEATNRYLATHPNAPYKTLRDILLAGDVSPMRARALMDFVNRSTNDAEYGAVMRYREALRVAVMKLMADHQIDALVYATYDAPPAVIPADALTNPRLVDYYGRGDNRGLSATLGWPAITVPMGFTAEALPAGLELLGRSFSEPRLLGLAYAYEQATKHRRPPATTPALR